MTSFPEEVLEHVFDFISSHKDRNSVSVVCQSWFRVERCSRRNVFIGNCYATNPERVISRFPRVKALSLKGKPHFADFNLVPHDWGAHVLPWIEAMARSYQWLEELKLKRMLITDDCLDLISHAFPNFKALVLISCEGFSTDGLASIAANCRNLRELDLQECEIEEKNTPWLSCFPETCTSLVSLNFACLKGEVNPAVLERLVARCPNLKSLKMNRSVPLEMLHKILARAPQLVELGTGAFTQEPRSEHYIKLFNAFHNCKNIKSLSGFWEVAPVYLPSIYSVCANLTSLNLSYALIQGPELIKLIQQCHKLQRLWILDFIEDKGLEAVASTCKDLQELRVFPSDPFGHHQHPNPYVTERGLVAVAQGCPRLHSLLYFCRQMTNAALTTIARSCPNFTRFRLCIIEPHTPDHLTRQPLDEGFGSIVRECKSLQRLSVSGLLTDQVFLYIGMYGKKLEMLSVAFAGESNKGMQYVLRGCSSLRKLEIRDSPFGDEALLTGVGKLETMRSLWMSGCEVSYGGCKELAERAPGLNVEVMSERECRFIGSPVREHRVDKVYVYRTLVGRREDMPNFVWKA